MSQQVNGHVVQVIGPVVDVEFPDQHLPAILNAITIVDDGDKGVLPVDVTGIGLVLISSTRTESMTISMIPDPLFFKRMVASSPGPSTLTLGQNMTDSIINVVESEVIL